MKFAQIFGIFENNIQNNSINSTSAAAELIEISLVWVEAQEKVRVVEVEAAT